MNFVYFLIVGTISGWVAGKIMKGGGFGLLGNLIVGIIGALVGGFVLGALNVSIGAGETLDFIVTSVFGSLLFFFLLGMTRKGK